MDNKQRFEEPLCDVVRFNVGDVISSSDDWGGGDIELWNIQDL